MWKRMRNWFGTVEEVVEAAAREPVADDPIRLTERDMTGVEIRTQVAGSIKSVRKVHGGPNIKGMNVRVLTADDAQALRASQLRSNLL